ncbi:hypothetical protein [Streptomyces sp. G-5]|uniref:hypothetical protein n=1 Tax=Streptomyces sp. G-5 TaxID=2977231 RepID=UPI0021D356A9|nr:hypothetical protein [Streptomyces sp. G-5]MCU4750067.1 hypothetical protein [Streptomyces sp. G-5]
MELDEVRRGLLLARDNIRTPVDYFTFQKELAQEIRDIEKRKDEDAKTHKHLLRLIGDSLAWELLDSHAIRELARDRLRPANLSSQGEDFDFVLSVAEKIAKLGGIPIVADVTHLVAVGDVVTVTPNGMHIAECKNRVTPKRPPTGRIARQEQRGAKASAYLTHGFFSESDEKQATAVEIAATQPAHDALRLCIEDASDNDSGASVARLGDRDLLLASWDRGNDPGAALEGLTDSLDMQDWEIPVMGGFMDAVTNPSPFAANPYALPIPREQRSALAEGELVLIRFVDLAKLQFAIKTPIGEELRMSVRKAGGDHQLSMNIAGVDREVSRRFIDSILWGFLPVSGIRETLIRLAEIVNESLKNPSGDLTPAPSPTIDTYSSFVYRGSEDPSNVVVAGSLAQLSRQGVHIPWEDLAEFNADDSHSLIPMMIFNDGGKLTARVVTEQEVKHFDFPDI